MEIRCRKDGHNSKSMSNEGEGIGTDGKKMKKLMQ